ncbi:MAG: hypothetical protein ACREMS_02350 [Gemmatimonadaceae bacterium]
MTRKRFVRILRLGFAASALTGCMRNVQAWPPPLETGTPVTVRFSAPRAIALDGSQRDSVAGVKELRGSVVSVKHDTLVVLVSNEENPSTDNSALVGRDVQVLLNQSTVVTRSETDGWKLAYGILAGAVLIFAGIVMSGS